MSWVEQAAPIVHEVIRRVGRSDLKALRREFRKAYPFGPRTNAPYKAWLSEIRRQPCFALRTERRQYNSRGANGTMPERYTLEHWEKCLPAMKRLHPDTLAIARSVYVDGVKPVEVVRQTGRSAQNVNSALKRVEPYLQIGAAGL
uniref:hypothetical protein n=1 Tax=Pseudomonas aeruginosa TaxID=287 RepID=UPI002359F34D